MVVSTLHLLGQLALMGMCKMCVSVIYSGLYLYTCLRCAVYPIHVALIRAYDDYLVMKHAHPIHLPTNNKTRALSLPRTEPVISMRKLYELTRCEILSMLAL